MPASNTDRFVRPFCSQLDSYSGIPAAAGIPVIRYSGLYRNETEQSGKIRKDSEQFGTKRKDSERLGKFRKVWERKQKAQLLDAQAIVDLSVISTSIFQIAIACLAYFA